MIFIQYSCRNRKKNSWKKASTVFSEEAKKAEEMKKEHEKEKEELIKEIGQLTVEVNWLKKSLASSKNLSMLVV